MAAGRRRHERTLPLPTSVGSRRDSRPRSRPDPRVPIPEPPKGWRAGSGPEVGRLPSYRRKSSGKGGVRPSRGLAADPPSPHGCASEAISQGTRASALIPEARQTLAALARPDAPRARLRTATCGARTGGVRRPAGVAKRLSVDGGCRSSARRRHFLRRRRTNVRHSCREHATAFANEESDTAVSADDRSPSPSGGISLTKRGGGAALAPVFEDLVRYVGERAG